jgi:hypothetical protein
MTARESMPPDVRHFAAKHTSYDLVVHNAGDKGCTQLVWTLLVPDSRARELTIDGVTAEGRQRVGEVVYREMVDGSSLTALLPGRPKTVATVKVSMVNDNPRPIEALYYLSCEDGRFPDHDGYGRVTLKQEKYPFP